MSAEFLEARVRGGYVRHAVRNDPNQVVLQPELKSAQFRGRTLCKRGRNGVTITTTQDGAPVPFEFKEHHCDRCMARVSVITKTEES